MNVPKAPWTAAARRRLGIGVRTKRKISDYEEEGGIKRFGSWCLLQSGLALALRRRIWSVKRRRRAAAVQGAFGTEMFGYR